MCPAVTTSVDSTSWWAVASRSDDWEQERELIRSVADAGAAGGSNGCGRTTSPRCVARSNRVPCESTDVISESAAMRTVRSPVRAGECSFRGSA
jgi:hypothetical protein